jgi:hypothetical protein
MSSLALGLAILGSAVQAHHAISAVYDSSKQVTVEGVVREFQFINPHPFLMMDAADKSGATLEWRLEMDNRFELIGIGIKADTLKAGDRLVVTGSLSRERPQGLYVMRLDRPADGFAYEQVGASPRIRSGRRP